MNDFIALIVVASALAGAIVFHARESAAWRAERSDLLNRLMARRWEDYRVLAQEPQPEVSRTQMTTDEIEAMWYEASAREQSEATRTAA